MKYVCEIEGELNVDAEIEVCYNSGQELNWNEECGACDDGCCDPGNDTQYMDLYPENRFLHEISIGHEGSEFVAYLDELDEGIVTGSEVEVVILEGKWVTRVTYTTSRELTDEEQDTLLSYTSGQCSDGIGEGFEQHECGEINDGPLFYSMWKRNGKQEVYKL